MSARNDWGHVVVLSLPLLACVVIVAVQVALHGWPH